jgi:predicted unusual protein kinase regulating ubiquinone biosynthesis (AarF/ABC1/UbiB family)
VLLDFGATRRFKASFVNQYRKLAQAAIDGNMDQLAGAAEHLGYALGEPGSPYREMVLEFLVLAMEPVCEDVAYDFSRSKIASNMSKLGEEVLDFKEAWKSPPAEAIYFHRKVGGMFLLASRLKARVNVYQLMQRWL